MNKEHRTSLSEKNRYRWDKLADRLNSETEDEKLPEFES